MLIDTHCHLNFKAFKNQVDQVIQAAKKVGVVKIIIPGADLNSSQKAIELAQKYDKVYAAVGIHPHHSNGEIKKFEIKQLRDELKKLAKNDRVVAIGECGLDYYQYQQTKYQDYQINDEFKKIQKEIFLIQIELAQKLNLPLIIHNRLASEDILELLQNFKGLKGVFHCFEGDKIVLNWALNHNFYLGITGNVTYNQKLQKTIKKIPLENLVLETDAPWLTPEPLRKQQKWPNRPENVKIVAERIAKIKGDSFLNVTTITSNNATKLFNLK